MSGKVLEQIQSALQKNGELDDAEARRLMLLGQTGLYEYLQRQEMRLSEIEKLLPALRALVWVGSMVGLSIIGQANIVFN